MMGVPMAHLLHAAGHELVVQDARPEVATGFADAHAGARIAQGATDFAACEVLITMLPNSDIVDAVLAPLAGVLKPGAAVIEMSSADPNRTRALATRLQEHGVTLIDAPVSGGVKKAVAGTLAIMVGGDIPTFERVRPVLETLGKAISHVGPVGAGHALKALNNYVSAAALIATAEAIHVGAAFGIDPATIVGRDPGFHRPQQHDREQGPSVHAERRVQLGLLARAAGQGRGHRRVAGPRDGTADGVGPGRVRDDGRGLGVAGRRRGPHGALPLRRQGLTP
ncbi:NAD binding domain of 6-phosphogluconate dehydrogenase domain-containing protein [Ditylenchus destructor]|nr:NAD binding domain of 6-phosphogluconate dehydrogenase domain-containing protein [Ditylenchus destructor]